MAEVTVNETQKPSEVILGKYQIHFEPGVHPFPFADIILRHSTSEQLQKKFDLGDLTTHAWNPQVAQRMRQYSPLAIGLDSVPGGVVQSMDDPYNWIWLPGSPKEMTGRNEVYIIGGDLLHFQLFRPGHSFEEDEANWVRDLRKMGWENVKQYATGTLGAELLGGHVALPLSMLLAYRLLSNKKGEKDAGVKDPGKRLFLKKAAVTVGALSLTALLGRLMPLMQSYSPTPLTEGPAQKITDMTKPFTRSTWLEGRTALVIAKTAEAMEKLGLPKGSHGSVVMGFPHGYEAGSLLTDKQARMEAIRKYAQEFFDYIYPTIPNYMWEANYPLLYGDKKPNEEEKRSFIMDLLLPFFTATTIYRIKEPKSYHVDNPDEAVKDLMEFVEWFPSQEVKEAVSPLGDPERFQREVKP